MRNAQKPTGSEFDFKSNAAEVVQGVELFGKDAIVTGGASGIGLEIARTLASAGARVVIAARDSSKAAAAARTISGAVPAPLDLSHAASIDQFAADYLSAHRELHMLINNAGIMAVPLTRDERGYESHFATNHLAHFQLTARLWPALRRVGAARVVSVSSRGHRYAGVDVEDANFERRPYDKWRAYGQSKTANILFARALDDLGAAYGVQAFSLHPGRVLASALSRHLSDAEIAAVPVTDREGRAFSDPADYIKTVEQGAATAVWCATSFRLEGHGGVYCEDCEIAREVPADSTGLGVRPYAIDPQYAQHLWALSERLTGVKFAAE